MKLRKPLVIPILSITIALLVLAACIAWGGPVQPKPMAGFNNPFKALDYSDLPPVQTYAAADGVQLAYRQYAPAGGQQAVGSVTLLHGSSASSQSMHPMAKALAAAGYQVFALDVRGHGKSGRKGQIDYVGQLESDMALFVQAARPVQPSTLAGFSSGGGFALRMAGSSQQALFGSYLLLSPFMGEKAPSQKPDSGGWVHIGIPRIAGLEILNAAGIRSFNHLPVAAFAVTEEAKPFLTPEYDYNLVTNFRPERDYMDNIHRVQRPMALLAGVADEAFDTEEYEAIFRAAGKNWPVQLLPGVGHIPLILEPVALQATVEQVRRLQQAG